MRTRQKVHEQSAFSLTEEQLKIELNKITPMPDRAEDLSEEQWEALERLKKRDMNDLMDELGPSGLIEYLEESPTIEASCNPTGIVPLGNFTASYPNERPEVIMGFLRDSEVMNIVGNTKSSKSWLAMNIAACIVGGGPLFDKPELKCEQGRVLVIDNELHPETIAARFRKLAPAMPLPLCVLETWVHYMSLRGALVNIDDLGDTLDRIPLGMYKIIILDSLYRFMKEDFRENENSMVSQVYNRLDKYASSTGSAIICVHHTSKGDQSFKSVTDTGAGGGAQSRACDAHLTIRPHQEDGVFVIEVANRSFKPVEPFCARFKFPKWVAVSGYDPAMLKGLVETRTRKAAPVPGVPPGLPRDDALRAILGCMIRPMTVAEIIGLGIGKLTNWGKSSVYKQISAWRKEGLITDVKSDDGAIGMYISSAFNNVTEKPTAEKPSDMGPENDDGKDSSETETVPF